MSKELEEVGQEITARIQQEFDAKNLNNTKLGQNSVSSKVVGGTKLSIEAFKRILFLQFGRRPRANYNENSWKEIYPAIESWVKRKLNVSDEDLFIVTKSIADKIQREGTQILRDRSKGLELEIILNEYIDQIAKLVTEKEAQKIVDQLAKQWQ